MESLVKSDIFFFITSIAVVLLTIIFAIVGCFLIKIMKNFSDISDTLKDTVHEAQGELQELTDHVKSSPLFTFIFGRRSRHKK